MLSDAEKKDAVELYALPLADGASGLDARPPGLLRVNAAIRIVGLLYSGCSVALQRKQEVAVRILRLASEGRLGGARRLAAPLGKVA